jgi:hypothetical protein
VKKPNIFKTYSLNLTMKKSILILFFVSLLIVTSLHVVKAQVPTSSNNNPGDARAVIAEEFGLPINQIPTDRTELERMYLQKEWTSFFANNSVSGPIHKFLSRDGTQIAFQALFAHKYELSLTFLLVFVWWVFFWIIAAGLIEAFGFVKGIVAVAAGGLVAVVLAWIQLVGLLATTCANLILQPLNWWTRAIVIVVLLGVFGVIYVIVKMLKTKLKKNQEEKTKAELEQQVKETRALNRGIRGG